MSTVRFGTLCDLCGAGSNDYAHDANACAFCWLDLCDACAVFTKHALVRDADEGHHKVWSCEDRPAHTSRMDAIADAETWRLNCGAWLDPFFDSYGDAAIHGSGCWPALHGQDLFRLAVIAVPALRVSA